MVTFLGTPNMLVTLKPPIGNIKRVRFNHNGEFTTENERMIARFHHKFDSKPGNGEEQAVDIEDDGHFEAPEVKQYPCKKCEFITDNKGLLMSHYRSAHKEEQS